MAIAKTLPSISDLSSLSQDEFVAALDGLYEHSPWVAASAWHKRPFRSFAALREALSQAVHEAAPPEQVALVRAHPELAGKAAVRGQLTAEFDARAERRRAGPVFGRGVRDPDPPEPRLPGEIRFPLRHCGPRSHPRQHH